MSSFGQDFASGMALGSSMYNNAQRMRQQDQEMQWRTEDRQRETDERKQLDELGKMMGKWEQGDFSPAIARANSSGMFGPNRFAAGARLGEDGSLYASVYDNKDPVNSLQEIKLGSAQDLKNQMVMAHAPPRILATIGVTQAQKQTDPVYQQQMQAGALGNKKLKAEVDNLPAKQAADLAHINASAATNQNTQHQALMGPAQLRAAQANATHAEWVAQHPYSKIPAAGEIIYMDKDGNEVREKLYPGDPRLARSAQAPALAGPQGQGAAQPPAAAPAQPQTPPSQGSPAPGKHSAGTPVNVPQGYKDGVYNIGGYRVQVKGGKGIIIQ